MRLYHHAEGFCPAHCLYGHFGAVDWQTTVYINGQEAGWHTGGYTEFTFDITNLLHTGDNEIVIRVYDPNDQGIGPHGKQVLNPQNICYTPTSSTAVPANCCMSTNSCALRPPIHAWRQT